jgi:hypothetical protein
VSTYNPFCVPTDGVEVTHSFTAPSSGTYQFDTIGSPVDTTVQIFDVTCGGSALACDGDGSGDDGVVIVPLAANQTVIAMVDTPTAGNYQLNVSPGPPCPQLDLGSTSPQTATGSTFGQANTSTGACATSTSPDVAYSFTAPSNGTYTFDTNGSAFDTVLYVKDGSCTGAEIACDDDSGNGTQSVVQVSLNPNETVVIYVDGFGTNSSGNYTLNVSGP